MFRLPLHGVRVLDLTTAWAGPYATRLLADMGAEVIKVEAVGNWDLTRSLTGQPPTTDQVWDKSPYFNHLNRNKYGCALDLSQEKGRDLFLRLVRLSDVVIDSFGAEAMDNLGLGYDALAGANPQVIGVSISGNGKSGAERDFVAYGTSVEQLSGLCHLSGYADGPPQKTGISYGDPMAGIAAAGAVALALWDRRRTGRGQHIQVAQRENLINVIGEYIVGYSMQGREPPRRGNRHSSMAPHGCYPCAGAQTGGHPPDDQWVAIACEDDAQFAALCGAMGWPELAGDGRFGDVVSRYRNQDALDALISDWARERTKDEATEALQAVGVPCSPVLSVPEVFAEPHLRARGFYESVSHSVAGVWEVEGPHWRLSESPGHIRLPAPAFGEHNGYVLGELLGLSAAEMAALEREGVTGTTPDWSVDE